jgi:hypothetical protein
MFLIGRINAASSMLNSYYIYVFNLLGQTNSWKKSSEGIGNLGDTKGDISRSIKN